MSTARDETRFCTHCCSLSAISGVSHDRLSPRSSRLTRLQVPLYSATKTATMSVEQRKAYNVTDPQLPHPNPL